MLKEITQYLVNNTASLTVTLVEGTNLFAGHYESDKAASFVIVEAIVPGIADYDLEDFWQKPIRIFVRNKSYFTGQDLAQSLFDLLHGKEQISLPVVSAGPTYLCNINGTTPAYIGQDQKGRFQFSINFMFVTQQVT